MMDKFLIEEWELEGGSTVFRVYEKVGKWPFRKWVLSASDLPTEADARLYIRNELMKKPRLVRRHWLRADMSEDSGW